MEKILNQDEIEALLHAAQDRACDRKDPGGESGRSKKLGKGAWAIGSVAKARSPSLKLHRRLPSNGLFLSIPLKSSLHG
jgi:hypothetical protein